MTSPNYKNSKFQSIANVDSNGAITSLDLGTVTNLSIAGGSNGQVLTTNGSGVQSWFFAQN